jgi:carbamoyl-phosphate synthase small subunit
MTTLLNHPYAGQIVVMTPSHIGNTGVNLEDVESKKVYLAGFIVQELSNVVSNWRSAATLDDYLKKAGVPGITGIDTRALTRYLRTQGAVNGLISANGQDLDKLVKMAKALPSLEGQDFVKTVSTQAAYTWSEGSGAWVGTPAQSAKKKKKVVVIDFGVKQNILRCLVDRNCDVKVLPANATADDVLKENPDGVLLSNGPGDPATVEYGIKTIRDLVSEDTKRHKKGDKEFALFGICLGHQLLGLALGGSTYKLKFGHHGGNHPIKDLETGQVDITAQNHGFCVEGEKKSNGEWIVKGNEDALVTHINLNDNAIEGLRHRNLPIFSVQYHPEASSGPHDARHLFNRFIDLMEKSGK